MTEPSKLLSPAAKPKPPNAGKGRVKGVPNKFTVSARQAFQDAFDEMGGVEKLKTWATAEPTEFYKLFARLIPIQQEHTGPGGGPIQSAATVDVSKLTPEQLRALASIRL